MAGKDLLQLPPEGEGLDIFLADFGLSFVAHLLATIGFVDHHSAVLIDKMVCGIVPRAAA